MKSTLLAVVATLLFPQMCAALDFELQYSVDAKALKDAVSGTPLTINLYEDSACATAPVVSSTVNVEDVDRIELGKRFTPKGAPKAARAGRIYVTTSMPPQRWIARYATVTGTGITPVGAACQRQYFSASSAAVSSVPASIVTISGPNVTLATLSTSFPSAGRIMLFFETELDATDVSQVLACGVSQDGLFVGGFDMDPGDVDTPIHNYDIRQSHLQVLNVAAGDHVYEVGCNLSTGAPVNTFGAKLVATFFEGAL